LDDFVGDNLNKATMYASFKRAQRQVLCELLGSPALGKGTFSVQTIDFVPGDVVQITGDQYLADALKSLRDFVAECDALTNDQFEAMPVSKWREYRESKRTIERLEKVQRNI
jgi:hypothetical protein